MLKVAKFGGSSLAGAEQFEKVKAILESDPSRKIVVVSAAGKRTGDDHKITDLLYLTHAHLKYGVSHEEIFSMIEERYYGIRDALGLKCDLESEFAKLRAELSREISVDYLVSRGEYLTARLMAEYLGFGFVDAKDCVFFRYDGTIDFEKTYAAIEEAALRSPRLVLPGFYGAAPNGRVRVMTRGGSDITGSLAANAVNADVYENWTDVSGILMADPRIVDHPQPIRCVTYDELRELAYMGASVLHDESIQPVKEKNIPLNIRNTNDPQDPGTLIVERVEREEEAGGNRFITGITGRKGFTVLTIHKKQIALNTAAVRFALEIFENFHVPVEHITLGVDSFTIMTPTAQAGDRIYDIIGEIRKRCQPDDLRTEENIAMIACVGRKMVYQPGTCGKLFGALGKNAVNIKAISQGTNEISILVGVHNRDFEKAIRVLYNGFVA